MSDDSNFTAHTDVYRGRMSQGLSLLFRRLNIIIMWGRA